jgi:hypothetical protein
VLATVLLSYSDDKVFLIVDAMLSIGTWSTSARGAAGQKQAFR